MKICLSHNVFYFWEGFLDTSFPGVIPFQDIVGIDIDGFELHVGLLSRRKICLGGLAEALKPFTKYSLNSVHVNMTGRWKDTPEEEKNHFSVFMKTLRNIIFPQYVVFHPNSLMPNIISSLDEIKSILPSMKIALENEDSLEKFGNSPNDFLDLMKSFPDLGLVVDTAHCQALDENMELASFIKHPILRKKIVSIHVGLCSNRYSPSLLEGDANRDDVVSAGDYGCVQMNFGSSGSPGILGDADGNGVVSASDYGSVQTNFGNTAGTVSPIPEPTALFILLAVGSIKFLKKRKNS